MSRTCTKCPLHLTARSVCIESDGPVRAKLLVVIDAPGEDEDLEGKPAVGRSGKLLRAALDNLGVEYRIAQVVRCRPPDNRKPLVEECASCREYLDKDLEEMQNLRVVVPLGEATVRAFGLKGQLLKLVGLPVKTDRYVVVPLAGPGYVLKNQSYLDTWTAHWDVVKALLLDQTDPAEKIGAVLLDHVEVE